MRPGDVIERNARRLKEAQCRRLSTQEGNEAIPKRPPDERWIAEYTDLWWRAQEQVATDLHAAGFTIIEIEPNEAEIERVAADMGLEARTDRNWPRAARAAHRAIVGEE